MNDLWQHQPTQPDLERRIGTKKVKSPREETLLNTYMKKLVLTFMIGFAVCLSALAKDDRIEIGSVTSRTGVRFLVMYVVQHNHYQQVYLIYPDGTRVSVDIQPDTTTAVLDHSLQQIVDNLK
jgi:hypothetical protein